MLCWTFCIWQQQHSFNLPFCYPFYYLGYWANFQSLLTYAHSIQIGIKAHLAETKAKLIWYNYILTDYHKIRISSFLNNFISAGHMDWGHASCLWRTRMGWWPMFPWSTYKHWRREVIPWHGFQICQSYPGDCLWAWLAKQPPFLCPFQVLCILISN